MEKQRWKVCESNKKGGSVSSRFQGEKFLFFCFSLSPCDKRTIISLSSYLAHYFLDCKEQHCLLGAMHYNTSTYIRICKGRIMKCRESK